MCGRYGLTIDQEALLVAYGVESFSIEHEPRYNIAPSQDVPVLVGDAKGPRMDEFRWGLIPSSASDKSIGYRTINARSETVHVRPAFRGAWRERRRCLVLADGFYEWQRPRSGTGFKVPYWIQMADHRPFGFAGLWERWDGDGVPVFSCTVLTTDANSLIMPIHDRMPVILGDHSDWGAWLDGEIPSQELRERFIPYPSGEMHAYPVSTYVNRTENEGPDCISPVDEGCSGDDSDVPLELGL